MNRILSSLALILAWMLMGTKVVLMASNFYVDPDYTGGSNDGSAAHPWISMVSNNWTVINASLATNAVTVYYSALKTGGTTQQTKAWYLEVRRSDPSTNRLTLDGYSFYNTSLTTGSWQANPNNSIESAYTNNQVFELTSDGWQALGWSRDSGNELVTRNGTSYRCIRSHISDPVNAPGTGANWQGYWVANPVGGAEWAGGTEYTCYVKQDNVTLRGFECRGTSSRVGFSGDNFLIECVWVHDATNIGPAMTLLYTTADNATDVIAAPSTNITIRNIRLENSRDEGLYLGAVNPDSPEAIQCAMGNQYDQITVTNFYISGAGTGGGQGDGIDCKNGITNLRISDGEIKNGRGTMGGIICPQTFSATDQGLLIERVYIHGLTNGTDERKAIYMLASSNSECFKGYSGITVRNCTISDCKWGIVCSSGIELTNINFYNNSVYNIAELGIVPNSTDGSFELNSNILSSRMMAWDPSPDPAVVGYAVYVWKDSDTFPVRFDIGPHTQVIIFGLQEGVSYYFTVAAYDAEGGESATLARASYVVPVPIRISPPLHAGDPRRVQFPVAPGRWYELQASSNLQDWTTIWQTGVANTYSWVEYQDLRGVAYPIRIYRVRVH